MGPRARRLYTLFAVLSISAMILIFVIGIQPPNDWALYITVGFFILTAIVWFVFENKRFQGPPIGDMIARSVRPRSWRPRRPSARLLTA